MDSFMSFLENKMMPPMMKLGNQRHLIAIRNGLVITLPAIIGGSLFLILGNLPIPAWITFLKPYQGLINGAINGTMGIIALLAAMGIGYELSKSYHMDPISGAGLSVMAFIITQLNAQNNINTANFGSSGLFTAIVASMVTVEIYHFFIKKNIIIKLPEGVPEAVSNSFVSLIPAIFILILFWTIRVLLHFDITAFIEMIFSPLVFALNSFPGILVYTVLVTLLWSAGIHGDMTLEGVADPIFLKFIAANAVAYAAHKPLPYITAAGFSSLFVNVGGTGATLCLVLLMLRSKNKAYRELGKVAFPGALFEINEPVIFGFPIVMNPLMLIPFSLIPLILAASTYLLMTFNLISRPVTVVPWTMPPIIGPMMATGWDWRAGLWSAIEVVIASLIYLPFFRIAEKQANEKEVNI
ncbi:PTS sugar transporter subunit IIC [Latilactobacillus curvatus]|uniref:PTS sugar transporter subunit IIC n=1 Tax=Latilactobacillus curvatus TaxID=28038 RepID=UPI000FECA683|nr:PTS transporter subunit EIIC [Latilactobacillus curvatus]QAR35531.1 PTS sugar transporter subunit IIC [Latilactobacillus curvatus]